MISTDERPCRHNSRFVGYPEVIAKKGALSHRQLQGWEESFQSWAKAPGQTEQTRCDNAVTAIRKAIDASTLLAKRNIRVFAQGSANGQMTVREFVSIL